MNNNKLTSNIAKFPNIWDTNFSLLDDDFFFAPDIFDHTWLPRSEMRTTKGRLGFTVPAMNVETLAEKYIFSLAVPGMKKENFTIEVKNNGLAITGKKIHKDSEKERKYTRQEYNYSAFSRFFPLPKDADHAQVSAKYDNGILVIEVAKKREQKPSGRKIDIL